jgi:hypothetical protein
VKSSEIASTYLSESSDETTEHLGIFSLNERPDKKFIRLTIMFITNFFYDLLFLAFIATQEVDDTSFLT